MAAIIELTLQEPEVSPRKLATAFARVWAGTSLAGCSHLRMNGPWRCGARADILLTFVYEDTVAINGIYALEPSGTGNAFEEMGRIVNVSESGPARLCCADDARPFNLLLVKNDAAEVAAQAASRPCLSRAGSNKQAAIS